MAGIDITLDHDFFRAGELIDRLIDAGQNLFDPFDEIGLMIAENAQENIRNSVQPDGQPLEPLADATKYAPGRGGDGAKPLLHHSNLLNSYVHEASVSDVVIGSNAIQAALMHAGGQAGRNRSVTIPARPVLGINDDDMDDIEQTLIDYLTAAA